MNLTPAIHAFNEASDPKIELHPTRDGRVTATLPRVGKQIMVAPPTVGNTDLRVTAHDVALLCEEARRAYAPGMALLTAALQALAHPEKVK